MNGVGMCVELQYFFLTIHSYFILKVDLPLCPGFAFSDGSSWYQMYVVFGDITLCTFSVAKASSHWKRHIFSHSFWKLFLVVFHNSFFPSVQRALLAVSKEGCPPTRSLTFLSHTCYLALLVFSFTHSFANSLSRSVKVFHQSFLSFSHLAYY